MDESAKDRISANRATGCCSCRRRRRHRHCHRRHHRRIRPHRLPLRRLNNATTSRSVVPTPTTSKPVRPLNGKSCPNTLPDCRHLSKRKMRNSSTADIHKRTYHNIIIYSITAICINYTRWHMLPGTLTLGNQWRRLQLISRAANRGNGAHTEDLPGRL